MKTRLLALVALLSIYSTMVSAQEEGENPRSPIWDRFFFGGGLGLQFGNLTYVDVSPMVGYRFTQKLHGGVGFTYMYYKEKGHNYSYETSSYGGRTFGRYFFLENFFGHVEFEILNMEVPGYYNPNTGYYETFIRDNITSLFVGGGYNQPIGPNAAIQFLGLWNLTEEIYSPYSNPIFRIGFVAGF